MLVLKKYDNQNKTQKQKESTEERMSGLEDRAIETTQRTQEEIHATIHRAPASENRRQRKQGESSSPFPAQEEATRMTRISHQKPRRPEETAEHIQCLRKTRTNPGFSIQRNYPSGIKGKTRLSRIQEN